MTSITPITPVQETDPALRGLPGLDRPIKKNLDQNDFLKLLAAQLANQDPLSPQSDTQFIAQMATFSSVEQMNAVSKSLTLLASLQELANSQSYLGRDVTITTKQGFVTGRVTESLFEKGETYVVVNGSFYPAADVVAVRPAADPVAGPTPSP